MADRSAHCCLCGDARRPTQTPVGSFGNSGDRIINIGDHRPLMPGRWEDRPQLISSVLIWRNGGSDAHTHMCDACIIVGLQAAKRFVDGALIALGADASTEGAE